MDELKDDTRRKWLAWEMLVMTVDWIVANDEGVFMQYQVDWGHLVIVKTDKIQIGG
jgi:hypothetical protein